MVNYVCRTCLYVCDNEFSFKKLEKVKAILEFFVPDVRNCLGNYSLICEQCYYFLRSVGKFKEKCMETQNKLYSINLETISDNHDAVLRSVVKNTCLKNKRQIYQRRESAFKLDASESRNKKIKPMTKSSGGDDIQFSTIVQTTSKPVSTGWSKTVTTAAANDDEDPDDLLQLLDDGKGVNDLEEFHEIASKQSDSDISPDGSGGCEEHIINSDEDDDEYMTRNDLVAAGVLPDWIENESDTTTEVADDALDVENECGAKQVQLKNHSKKRPESHDLGRTEVTASKQIKLKNVRKRRQTTDKLGRTEMQDSQQVEQGNDSEPRKIYNSSNAVEVKQEMKEYDENPGFFNKQSSNGFYECKLCDKKYKTSKGLYNHTKEKHADLVRIHYCQYCSFFTLWKSALVRHCSIFHEEIFQKNINSLFKCSHCNFETRSRDQLERHILDNHVYEKFVNCSLCRARFPDNLSFAKHVETEHLDLDMPMCSNYCSTCALIFFTDEDFNKHVKELHENSLCVLCKISFSSKDEFREHQKVMH